MAAVTLLGTQTFNTTSGTHTVTATPAVGDLIVIVRAATGNATSKAPTDNNSSGTYSLVTNALKASSADLLEVWVRNALITSATSTIFTEAPGTTTGGGLGVFKITGMAVAGSAAIRQSAVQANHASGSAPAPVFSAAPLSSNPIIGAVFNATSPATLTPRTNFTERFDVGYSTPTAGLETMSRDSGETATTQTWGSSSASAFCSIVVELQFNTSPTVALNSPADTATGVSVTPQLQFTGTDADGDAITYEIQVDTVNTFDSQVAASVNATIEVWGAGGGGTNVSTAVDSSGNGGGGGAYSKKTSYSITQTGYAVTVGAAGAGGVSAGANGSAGGDSWFNTSADIMAKGGGGGIGAASGAGTGGTGGASASGFGTTKTSGGNGAASVGLGSGGAGGGSGGDTTSGGNASGATRGAAGTTNGALGGTNGAGAGAAPGGGGGGANSATTGGVGGAGQVIITIPTGVIASASIGSKTTVGPNDIWTITSSGTWTPTFVGSPLYDKLSNTDTGFTDITNATFSDLLKAASLDTSLWTQTTGGSATVGYSSSGVTVTYPSSSTSSTLGQIASNSAYNFTGKSASLCVSSVPASGTSADAEFRIQKDSSNWLRWIYEGGTLFAQQFVAGSRSNITSFAYSSTTHKYWRIREASGTTFWDTSADGTTWTNQGSAANPITVTALSVMVLGSCFQNETSPGTFAFSSFNADPYPSSDQVGYTTPTLTSSTTYYWRVRGKDPWGTNTFGALATTQSFTTTSGSSSASIAQVAASVTATGGTQAVTASALVNASIAQVAATVTATGGTQAVAAVRKVSIIQVAATVTASGGTATVLSVSNAAITQLAATITATGGTQGVSAGAFVNISITQVAATVTATGGTQAVAASRKTNIAQVAATITATGGTQVIATSRIVSITQLAATVTATGGTQTLAAARAIAIAQVAATITATGGTPILSIIIQSIIGTVTSALVSGGNTNTLDSQTDIATLESRDTIDTVQSETNNTTIESKNNDSTLISGNNTGAV